MFIDKEDEVFELVPAGPDDSGLYGLVLKEHAHLIDRGVNVDIKGELLPHDILEHAVSKGKKLIGYEDELQAIGCAFWIRGVYGKVTAEGIASEVHHFLEIIIDNDITISMPESVSDEIIDVIKPIKKHLEFYMQGEYTEESDKELANRMLAHIALGYSEGLKMYEDDSHTFELYNIIQNVLKENAKENNFEEDVMNSSYMEGSIIYKLHIDYQYLNVKLEKIYPEELWDMEYLEA
jgi:hypothetical protein